MSSQRKKVTLKIKNFKSLENISLELKPLTLILGPNSSGKSSLLKALKFLDKNLFPLAFKNLYYCLDMNTDLGSYADIITDNDINKNVVFEINISGADKKNEYGETFEDIIDKYLSSVNYNNITLDKVEDEDVEFINSNQHYYTKARGTVVRFLMTERSRQKNNLEDKIRETINTDRKYLEAWNIFDTSLQVTIEYENLHGGSLKYIRIEDKNYGFIYEILPSSTSVTVTLFPENESLNNLVQEFFIQAFTLQDIHPFAHVNENDFRSYLVDYFNRCDDKKWKKLSIDVQNDIIKRVMLYYYSLFVNIPSIIYRELSFYHLPTIRQIPQRVYLKNNNRINDNYYGLLQDFASDNSDKIKRFLSEELKNFEFSSGINIVEDTNTISLIYKAAEGKCENNLSEASSGLIQFLPILYKVFKNNRLLIEQPELHLHPKLQAKLAEFFVSIGNFEDKCLLIETHSEHLIRKLQVLIAKKKITNKQVAIYYFHKPKGKKKTKIKKMEIEEGGLLKESWPDGFYDSSYQLSKELLFSQG